MMLRVIRVAAIAIFACCVARSQQVGHSPAFEVASVKPSPPMDRSAPPSLAGCRGGPGTADPGVYTCRYATIQGLVIEAFGL